MRHQVSANNTFMHQRYPAIDYSSNLKPFFGSKYRYFIMAAYGGSNRRGIWKISDYNKCIIFELKFSRFLFFVKIFKVRLLQTAMLLLTTTQCVQGQTLSRCLGNDFKVFSLHRLFNLHAVGIRHFFMKQGRLFKIGYFLGFFANSFHHPNLLKNIYESFHYFCLNS